MIRWNSCIHPNNMSFHFLPVKSRINYKIAMLTYKCLNNKAPQYLQNLIHIKQPNDSLRSSTDLMILEYPPFEKAEYKKRRFTYAAPTVWNGLPRNLKCSPSLERFKKDLKTFYFNDYYNAWLVTNWLTFYSSVYVLYELIYRLGNKCILF